MNARNLKDVAKTVSKSILLSFLIILIFSVVTVNIVYINYINSKEKIALQKQEAVFLSLINEISDKLYNLATTKYFLHCIHSGALTRQHIYPSILFEMRITGLDDTIIGMEIFNKRGQNILSFGEKTKDEITLDLCYLNRRMLNYQVGNCKHTWKLYFDKKRIVKKLKEIDPELKICNDCGHPFVAGKYFGIFPISHISGLEINMATKGESLWMLFWINFFIICILSMLAVWNVGRVRAIFRKYLFDPIIEITSMVRENKPFHEMDMVEELMYLIKQIDQWKNQVLELERVKIREKAQEERIKMLQSIGASITHELRTPLRSIMSGVSGIEKFLPILLKSHNLAKESGLPVDTIRDQQVRLLHKVLANLKKEGASTNTIIDMFLMKMRGNITELASIQLLSIAECVNEALERYVFQGLEKNLIVFDSANNFQFKGDKILTEHILFNLLKNALYYIAKARKGRIYISFGSEVDESLLYFKDTGKGIAKEVLPNIFNRFYSKTEGGVGIGLSFCKMAMEWMGGYITCESVENEYVEFVLHFPKLEE